MFRTLITSLMVLLVPSSALASQLQPHPFPVLPYNRGGSNYFGYSNLQYMYSAIEYFRGIIHKRTNVKNQPYTYCHCRPYISMFVDPRHISGDVGVGEASYYEYSARVQNGVCRENNSYNFVGFKQHVEWLEGFVASKPDFYQPIDDAWVVLSIHFDHNFSSLNQFGCSYAPVVEEKNCPKVIIRGLPIFQGTVRCNKFNLDIKKSQTR